MAWHQLRRAKDREGDVADSSAMLELSRGRLERELGIERIYEFEM